MNNTLDNWTNQRDGLRSSRCLRGPVRVIFKVPVYGEQEDCTMRVAVSHFFTFKNLSEIPEEHDFERNLGSDEKEAPLGIWKECGDSVRGYLPR